MMHKDRDESKLRFSEKREVETEERTLKEKPHRRVLEKKKPHGYMIPTVAFSKGRAWELGKRSRNKKENFCNKAVRAMGSEGGQLLQSALRRYFCP